MKKSLLALAMALFMLCGSAFGAELPRQGAPDLRTEFERYTLEWTEAGDWNGWDTAAGRIRKRMEAGIAGNLRRDGLCLLYPSLRGDDGQGLTEPVLHVWITRNRPVGALSCFFVSEGICWSVAQPSETVEISGQTWEKFTVPLDCDGVDFLHRMARSGCVFGAFGEGGFFQETLLPGATEGKSALEAEGLQAVSSFLNLLPENYGETYGLWAENALRWPDNRPEQRFSQAEAAAETEEIRYLADFALIDAADGSSVKGLQRALTENGFFVGKQDGKYTAQTMQAVCEAQRYWNLPETGAADRALMACLAGNAPTEDPSVGEQSVETIAQDGVELRLTGYRYAAPNDGENLEWICTGEVENLSEDEAFLPLIWSAQLRFGGKYTYSCDLYCEKIPENTTALKPLERGKAVLRAEIPAAAAELPGQLILTGTGGEIWTLDLR